MLAAATNESLGPRAPLLSPPGTGAPLVPPPPSTFVGAGVREAEAEAEADGVDDEFELPVELEDEFPEGPGMGAARVTVVRMVATEVVV